MSGFVAVFHPDGRPVHPSQIARGLDAIAHRGPHGTGSWQEGSVALGHARFTVTRHAAQPQPVVQADCAIVFDGRLDNRDEIGKALPDMPAGAGDAAIVLAAYRAWGEDSAARLLGDFAYAIWDGGRRALVCARDFVGQQPLFYHASDGLVIVASEPRGILADTRVPRAIDEQTVAEHLTSTLRTREATLYAAVRRLEPAHLLVADARGCRTRPYWTFDPSHEIRYRDAAQYGEHFLDLFSRAIDCRLESCTAVALFLSGGVDSSAVAGAALPLAQARDVPLHALALRFPGRTCDEGPYIDAVARHTGIAVQALEMLPARADTYRRESAASLDIPQYPNGTMFDPLRAAAGQAGTRVILTGYGGDDWFTGSPAHATDLVRRWRLIAAWRQLRADARLPGRGFTLAGLGRAAIAPLVPERARRLVRRVRGRAVEFDWLTAGFRRRTSIEPDTPSGHAHALASAEQAGMYHVATCAATVIGNELEERAASLAGVEERHPFNDRRLAEFALAVPSDQRWSGTETKVVLRGAMRRATAVPDYVLARDDKAEFSSSFVDALNAFGGPAAFTQLRAAERGWVDGAKVRALYPRMMALYSRNDEAYIPLSDYLWSVLSLEVWLGALEADGATQPSGIG